MQSLRGRDLNDYVRRYGGAVAITIAALLLRLLLSPVLRENSPFLLFWPAIVVSALVGGVGPGLVATLLGTLFSVFYLLPPLGSFGLVGRQDQIGIVLFVSESVLMVLLTNALCEARRRAEVGIEERRQAEQAALGSEARTRAILAAALDCIVTIDAAGRIVEFNAAAERTFGYSCAAVIGHEMAGLIIPPALREQHRRGLAHYLASDEGRIIGRRIEMHAMRAGGSAFPIELTVSRLPGDGPPMFTGFIRDISARKRAEEIGHFLAAASEQLASSLDYPETLTQLAQLAVPYLADWCAVDMVEDDGSYRRLALAHRDPAKVELAWEIERRYGFDPLLAEGAAKVLRTGEPAIYTEISPHLIEQATHDPEHARLIQSVGLRSGMIVPLTARGRTLGALSFGAAESGRSFGADDLELAEDLARRAALAIDNARLYAAAQAAIRTRDEFLSIAAHEMKTPMTSLTGYAQVLQRRFARDKTSGERDRRAVDVIAAQAERLSRLIAAPLDVSRIETGHFTLDRQLVDLPGLVRRVVEEAQPALDRHTLELRAPDGGLVVEGDALRLEQVLQNLIQNAIKYSPEGGPVNVRVDERAGRAAISVSDKGIGVPAEAQPRLFQRFFRAANLAGSSISGMGIGLYVVREIVSRHGGTVDVASQEGEGSTFTISLPLAELRAHAGAGEHDAEPVV